MQALAILPIQENRQEQRHVVSRQADSRVAHQGARATVGANEAKGRIFEAVVEELKKDYGISILKKRATQSCESSCCGSSQG
ncbi:hypothetical protein [Aeromonas jandaei]|uniref:hypothetical protein n=1 Tax=Aeromonas jandaei TaxID=650 RepID=UPI003B9E1C0C